MEQKSIEWDSTETCTSTQHHDKPRNETRGKAEIYPGEQHIQRPKDTDTRKDRHGGEGSQGALGQHMDGHPLKIEWKKTIEYLQERVTKLESQCERQAEEQFEERASVAQHIADLDENKIQNKTLHWMHELVRILLGYIKDGKHISGMIDANNGIIRPLTLPEGKYITISVVQGMIESLRTDKPAESYLSLHLLRS